MLINHLKEIYYLLLSVRERVREGYSYCHACMTLLGFYLARLTLFTGSWLYGRSVSPRHTLIPKVNRLYNATPVPFLLVLLANFDIKEDPVQNLERLAEHS